MFVNTNIDITSYLSTIKQISNTRQAPKDSESLAKPIESYKMSVVPKKREASTEKVVEVPFNNKGKASEGFRRINNEAADDIFIDEASEMEEEQPEKPVEVVYSPVSHQRKAEEPGSQNTNDRV